MYVSTGRTEVIKRERTDVIKRELTEGVDCDIMPQGLI
jgi:hypothetical protein